MRSSMKQRLSTVQPGLITKIDGMDADDEVFDANFTVLSEYIKHHVKEEGELFPKIRKSDLDLDARRADGRAEGRLMAELELH